jgi:hypothetical protein
MTLIWQVPAVTVAISGALVGVTYAYKVPDGVWEGFKVLRAFMFLATVMLLLLAVFAVVDTLS